MLRALVTTRRPGRPDRARATSVVVVPAVEADRGRLGRDQVGGGGRDRSFRVVVLAAPVAHGQLVEDSGRDRPSVRAGEQVLLLEAVQVAAYRGLRDVQLLRQLGDADRAALVEPLQDQPQADVLSHGVHNTRTFLFISRTARAAREP